MNSTLVIILEKIVPKDLIHTTLAFVQMLNPKPLSDLTIIFHYPELYHAQCLRIELSKQLKHTINLSKLFLSCFVTKHFELSLEIISYMFQHKTMAIEESNRTRALFEKRLTHPATFLECDSDSNSNSDSDININSDSDINININNENSHFANFRLLLFHAALETNDIGALQSMCTNVPDKLGELMCAFAEKFSCVSYEQYVATLAFKGDIITLKCIFECQAYKRIIVGADSNPIILTGAMYGGHFDLTVWLITQSHWPLQQLRRRFILSLLRCNHLDVLERVLSNPYFCPDKKMEDIAAASAFYVRDIDWLPNLPKITLKTFLYIREHCHGGRGKFMICREIFSDEVLAMLAKEHNF